MENKVIVEEQSVFSGKECQACDGGRIIPTRGICQGESPDKKCSHGMLVIPEISKTA